MKSVAALILAIALLPDSLADSQDGESLYLEHCASCHGKQGEGVFNEYEYPLTGKSSVEKLSRVIHRTMPEGDEDLVRDAEATTVARYMHEAFYSPEAWQRVHPVKIEPWRLSRHQLEFMAADRLAKPVWPDSEERGTAGGKGSLLPEDTGDYQFLIRSAKPFSLWVNGKQILDSGMPPEPRRPGLWRATVRLLGGRAYPFRIEGAEANLTWIAPGESELPIPDRCLSPHAVPASFVLNEEMAGGPPLPDEILPGEATTATRLALVLWDSVPDSQLVSDVEAATRRMLRDPRTRIKMRRFFHDWLALDHRSVVKNNDRFPTFKRPVAGDLRHSLDRFIDDLIWEGNGDYRALFRSETLPFNRRLAALYGSWKEDNSFSAVPSPDHPAGILTHPLVMASLASSDSSLPFDRGVFITRRMFGRNLQSPHPDISVLGDIVSVGTFAPGMTNREKYEAITTSRHCLSCHAVINPLGFGLENYDAIGRFRLFDEGKTIDSSGTYETRSGDTIQITGAKDIADAAANSEDAQRAFMKRFFRFMTGQDIMAYGTDFPDILYDAFRDADFNIRELLVEIAIRVAT